MTCDETVCLDKRENTKVAFGSKVMKLDDFEDMVNKDPSMKKKIDQIEKELEQY